MRSIPLRVRFIVLTTLLVATISALVLAIRPESAIRTASPDVPRRIAATVPLLFEVLPRGGAYLAHGAGYQFVFDASRVELAARAGAATARVAMHFPGARRSRPTAEMPQTARVNYLVGDDTNAWRTNVQTYGRLRYASLYDGIDAVFYGNGRQLEYDLVVAPGADATAPRIAFDGVDATRIDNGDLVLTVGGREMRQSRPVAYQMASGKRRPVTVDYELTDRVVRFAVGDYDRTKPLVIDPVFVYSTLYGGSQSDGFYDVAVDATGAAYVAGYTFSRDFAGTPQPGTPTPGDSTNVVVVKLDRDGRVVYSTTFGGSQSDLARGIAVDIGGSAYVVGFTTSPDFPTTTGAFQRTLHGVNGQTDLFVAKLSAAGSQLAFATYFGGWGDEDISDIAVNAAGQAYVAGTTNSGDLPVTSGALDTANTAGNFSGFAAKFNAAGTGLIYSTYLTGQSQWATAIALDNKDRAVIAGSIDGAMTTTTTFGALGARDAFVIALNETGTGVQYASRFGGAASDSAAAVAIGPQNKVYVVGTTNSTDFPADQYASEGRTLQGSTDAFVTALWGSSGSLSQSRYFGGSGTESGLGVTVTDFQVTVLGDTSSTDLPTREALQSSRGSLLDGFVARFYGATEMRWSTYLGGSANDYPHAVAVDGVGAITVVGETVSPNFPLKNPVDSTGANGSGQPYEGFVTRFATRPRGTPGSEDVVVHVADTATLHGNWVKEADSTAAGGFKLRNVDHGAAKVTTAKASPTDYFEFTLDNITGEYRVWVRGKADKDSYNNDSVYLQFSYADDGLDEGQQLYPIGSTSGMAVVLEQCQGCGVHGWGWTDDGYGPWAAFRSLNFYSGRQPLTVRVQAREDGLSIDEIVFSPSSAFGNDVSYTWAPGYQKDDDTILPDTVDTRHDEIVLVAGSTNGTNGNWRGEFDDSADAGFKVRHPDAGAAKLSAPLANPVHYVEWSFDAKAGIPYRLWIRGRADADSWANDSAYVQFSGSVTANGTPIWRIGTTSATTYVLEDCSGCGVKGWGWNDNGYGTGVFGQLVYFAEPGLQVIRIQTREDGLALDQIVLSAQKYMNDAPGQTKNDTTLLAPTQE
jgi:hypothetical protein